MVGKFCVSYAPDPEIQQCESSIHQNTGKTIYVGDATWVDYPSDQSKLK